MKKHLRKHQSLILAALAALPLTFVTMQQSGGLTGSAVIAPPVIEGRENIRDRARAYRATAMQERRMFTQFREKCRDRASVDPTFVCPNYNDRSKVRQFLMSKFTVETPAHAAAPSTDVTLNENQLSDSDQYLMDRYQNAGTCPESLKNYTPGFYDLCRRLLTKTTSRGERRGVLQKVEERFKVVKDAQNARKAARLERLKKASQ